MNEKVIFVKEEGNAWWNRNKETVIRNKNHMTNATKKLYDFLIVNPRFTKNSILEIGCSAGYNLINLYKALGSESKKEKFSFYGIDPSKEAIEYGNIVIKEENINIHLDCTTADQLPYSDDSMDCVIIGFCLFCIERKYLYRSISEIDRVLKTGGLLILEDFDTMLPYIRNNIHNPNVYTYKMNYSNLFLANPQYCLVEKYSYSHYNKEFHEDKQERVSTCILHKESCQNSYILNKDIRS